MANNPKVKVDADLSSVEAELASLQQTVVQLGETLKTSSGKAHFNFNGAQKELNALIARADKLTEALNKGDTTSARYAKNLRAAEEAMTKAAKVAAKLEEAGTARTNKVSGYFHDYSVDLAQERAATSRANASAKERAELDAQAAREAQSRHSQWGSRATKLAGIVGGSVLGGGTYANIGSLVGGALGPVGSFVGGMVGGAADRFISPAREEAKTFSELRRMVGSTTTDFDNLRDSVRSVVHGMGVTDNEAANLAKQFAHTASLTGDATDTIARSMGTSTGFAQSYGMAPSQATAFFAQMRLTGGANNDKDNRRLAMLIGESVSRGGTSAKMDEVLSAVANFATRSAQQSLTAPNVGQYSSYLASLTGSSYAGIKGDPNNAAQLMGMMDAGVANGGTMGEASQYHWLQARQSAFKGMSAMDNSLMQTAGATGDLTKLFAPGSPAYDNANEAARAQMDKTRESILASGFRNNFQVGMAHIKAISNGDSYLENASFRGMFGGNVQQAAVLMHRFDNDKGLGNLEKELSRYGIGLDNVNVSQMASFSELLGGGEKAMSAQYEKLLGSGKLSKAELDVADKTMAKDGYGEEFKKLLLNLTAKYDADDGLKSQTSMIDISNKIQEGVSNLVGIETDVREYLLRLLNSVGVAGPVLDRMTDSFMKGLPEDGTNMLGEKGYGGRSKELMMREVKRSLGDIAMAGSQEAKDAAYNEVMGKVGEYPRYYPRQMHEWAKRARGGHEVQTDKPTLGVDTDQPTIPAEVGPTKRDLSEVAPDTRPAAIRQKIIDEAKRQNVPAEVALALAQSESSMGARMVGLTIKKGMHAGDRAMGPYQYMAKSAEGWDRTDPDENIRHGVADLKKNYAKFGSWGLAVAAHHAGPGSIKNGKIPGTTDGQSSTRDYVDRTLGYAEQFKDQMPESQRRTPEQEREKYFSSKHEITLYDRERNLMADPVTISTRFGAPVHAGG